MDFNPNEQSGSSGLTRPQASQLRNADRQTQSSLAEQRETRQRLKAALVFFTEDTQAPDLTHLPGLFRLFEGSPLVLTCILIQPTWLNQTSQIEQKAETFVDQVDAENETFSPPLIKEPLDSLEAHFDQFKSSVKDACQQASVTLDRILTFDLDARDEQLIQDALQRTQQDLVIFYQISASQKEKTRHDSKNQAPLGWLKHSPLPVLIYRQSISPKPSHTLHLLLGIDQSEASMNAVRRFPTLIHPENMHLTLAHVQTPIYQQNGVLGPYVNQAVLDEAMEANAQMIFEMAKDLLESEHVVVSDTIRAWGTPGPVLEETCQRSQPDLVIVGAHNRKGFLGWLLGSVSKQLLQDDTHNLLIIH